MKFIKQSKEHLYEHTEWGYWGHLWHSVTMGAWLIKTAMLGMVHGLFPWIWKAEAPRQIIKMYYAMKNLKHSQMYYNSNEHKIYEENGDVSRMSIPPKNSRRNN